MKNLHEMKELKRFQGSTFDEFSRRTLIENQDTILELTARIQELQNEVNCMSDSRDFKDAESVRSGLYHVCQGAQDKQLTQYLLVLRSKWKMLQNY